MWIRYGTFVTDLEAQVSLANSDIPYMFNTLTHLAQKPNYGMVSLGQDPKITPDAQIRGWGFAF